MRKHKIVTILLLLGGFLIGYFNQQLSLYFLNYNALIGLLVAFIFFLVWRVCELEARRIKKTIEINLLEQKYGNIETNAQDQVIKKLTELSNKIQLERNRETLSDAKLEQLIKTQFSELKNQLQNPSRKK